MLPPVHSPLPLRAVARTGWPIGAKGRLSSLLSARFHAARVVLTDRGTSALQLALDSAFGEGDRVVALPAFSCYDIVTAAVGADARIALYDVDPGTLGPDMPSLEAAVAAGATVVVIAVPFGYPPDWPALSAFARARGVALIEDAAQSHGGRLGGARLGSLGDRSVLSFGRGKGWTGGGGGALLLRRDAANVEPAHPVRSGMVSGIRTPAMAAVLAVAARPTLYRVPAGMPWLGLGETHYREPERPRAMAATVSAILLGSDKPARRDGGTRRAIGRWYEERLAGWPLITYGPTASPGYLRFPLRVPVEERDRILSLGLPLGVVATYPTTLADLPAVRQRRVESRPLPGAETLVRELVTLPTYGLVDEDERHRVIRLLTARPFHAPPSAVAR